jgi:RHS repeat-associated protein
MRQLVKHVDSLGRATQYAWCSCGSLSHLTDGNGNETTWNHDILGRPIQKVFADGSQVNYVYEQVPVPATTQITLGRLSTVTDALGQTKTFSYNMDNTVSQIAYTNSIHSTPTRTFAYDPNYMRLSSATNSWGMLSYAYNAYATDPFATPITGGGRLSTITPSAISSTVISFGYDALGRLTNRSVNGSANSDSWGYDAISRATSESSSVLGNFAFSYGANASYGTHELASITYPIGSPTAQTSNFTWWPSSSATQFEQLEQITNVAGGTSPPNLSQYSNNSYNAVGDLTQWVQAVTTGGTTTTNTMNLGYDLADQLLTASGSVPRTYTYDNAANQTSVNNGTTTTTATPNDLNQITALSGGTTATLQYGSNGNLSTTNNTYPTYSWDAENRLIEIQYSLTSNSQFTYDPMGGLVEIVETVSGSVTSTKQFVRTSGRILEERNASNTIEAQFFDWGQSRSGSNYYYTKDHLGSIRDVTNSTGATQVQYGYDPYGNVTTTGSGTPADFQFAGYYYHAASGLNLTVNRAYSSSLGRFLNRDPIAESGGTNLYAYVGNGPIGFSDPSGTDLTGAAVGGVIGGVAGGIAGAVFGGTILTPVFPGVGTGAGIVIGWQEGFAGGGLAGAAWGAQFPLGPLPGFGGGSGAGAAGGGVCQSNPSGNKPSASPVTIPAGYTPGGENSKTKTPPYRHPGLPNRNPNPSPIGVPVTVPFPLIWQGPPPGPPGMKGTPLGN